MRSHSPPRRQVWWTLSKLILETGHHRWDPKVTELHVPGTAVSRGVGNVCALGGHWPCELLGAGNVVFAVVAIVVPKF